MTPKFKKEDKKAHTFQVKEQDFATFNTGVVHKVCSTFALSREMEWASRLFVLEMTEDNEEGVGTFLEIEHQSPAFLNDRVEITASVESIIGNELICRIEVKVGDRKVARGRTGQKIFTKEKINQIFTSLER